MIIDKEFELKKDVERLNSRIEELEKKNKELEILIKREVENEIKKFKKELNDKLLLR